MTKRDAYICNEMQLQTHSLTFIHKNKPLPSATSTLYHSPMAYNTTTSLNKLTCADYVDFGKCQDRSGQFSWTKIDSNYLKIKLKVLKGEDKIAEFRPRQNFSMREADSNRFFRQRNQLVVAADNLFRDQNLSSVLQSTLSKNMEEQVKLVLKVIDVVDCPSEGFV